MRELKP